jgi:hypothetical protein
VPAAAWETVLTAVVVAACAVDETVCAVDETVLETVAAACVTMVAAAVTGGVVGFGFGAGAALC